MARVIWLLLRALWDLHRRYLGANPLVIWVSAEVDKVQGYVTQQPSSCSLGPCMMEYLTRKASLSLIGAIRRNIGRLSASREQTWSDISRFRGTHSSIGRSYLQ
ncbi:hypothetical protein HZ326_24234 [Fusarium oxysporum f. sp. albedinis]|nr:hypothetical protein HZ326_24234 [Fusarium oxysporum f. sp. albedinis]